MKKQKTTPVQKKATKKTPSIHGLRLNNLSEIKPDEREKFLLNKIDRVRAKQKKITNPEEYKNIEQPLTLAKERIKKRKKIAPVADSLAKPVTRSASVSISAAAQPQQMGALPALEDVNVFKATANIFGVEAVPVEGIEEENGSLVNLSLAEENFTFDQLFSNFNCENLDLFVFDDVNIHLEEQKIGNATKYITQFNGNLRMDRAPLSSLADFLKSPQSIMVSGEIETSGQDLTDKITPTSFTLTSAGTFLVQLTDDILLDSAALTIKLAKDDSNEGVWTLEGSISGKLQINRFTAPLLLDATVSYAAGTLHVSAETASAAGLFTLQNLTLQNVSLEFNIGEEKDIELVADLMSCQIIFHLAGKISSESAGLIAHIDQFNFNDLNGLYKSVIGDTLQAIPDVNVEFSDVSIGLATGDCTIDSIDLEKGFSIACSVKVYEYTCKASAVFSTSGVSFTGELGNISVGPVNITKAKMTINLNAASAGKVSGFAILGEAVIEGLTVDCKLAYEKTAASKVNTLVYASVAAENFGMSTIFPQAKGSFIDTFRFSKVAFIYSSEDGTANDPDFDFKVRQGLQLIGVLEEISALSTLTQSKKTGLVLSAHYGTTTDISIEMPDVRMNLGPSVVCDELRIGIVILPEPAMDLLFGIAVTVPKQADPLHFDLMLEIGLAEARGSATMKGYWVNPFGVNGLQIGPELALQIGIIYAEFVTTGLPSEFGFAGGLKLGDIVGKMAVSISEDPTHEILMGEVAQLSPKNLVSFVSSVTGISIDDADIPNFFDLEELKLYCAPTGGTIGTITFEQGFSFAADLTLFDKRINVYALLNESGIIVKGELDQLEIGPLKITGAHGGNPKLDLELTQEKQSVFIDGGFDFLGTGESIYVDISNKGVTFELEQSFLGLLKYIIRFTSSGSLSDPVNLDFSLYAEFDNDLTTYIKTTVVQKINDARAAVDTSIEDAQEKVDAAEKVYLAEFTPAKNALDKAQTDAQAYLDKCTKDVSDQKAIWDKKISDAQAQVINAKGAYDNALADAQYKVSQAKIAYDNSMSDAQQKVNDAQIVYNNAFNNANANLNNAINNYNNSFGKAISDLNNAQAAVNSLQNQINYYQYKIDHAGWKDYFGNVEAWGIAIGGLQVAKGTASLTLSACQAIVNGFQTTSVAIALNTARAALNAAQTGGNAIALEGAKQTLNAMQYGAGWIAFQTAQSTLDGLKYGAQYTVWQTAAGTLNAAQTTGRAALTAAEFALNNIGTSAVYLALQGAQAALETIKQGTAAAAFDSAKAILEGTKQGTEGVLDLSAYIASNLGAILEVNKVTLNASLKGIERGELFVSTFDGSVLGKAYHTTIDFNVKDVAAFIDNLFASVYDEAKRIASS